MLEQRMTSAEIGIDDLRHQVKEMQDVLENLLDKSNEFPRLFVILPETFDLKESLISSAKIAAMEAVKTGNIFSIGSAILDKINPSQFLRTVIFSSSLFVCLI
jgi:hypothetical protein